MKKFIALISTLFISSVLVFADKVITADDLDASWVDGKWSMDVTIAQDGESQTVSALVDIKGHKDNSKVIISAEGEKEEITMEEFKETLFEELPGEFPVDDEMLALAETYGITIKGDTKWRLTDDKKKLYFSIVMTAEGVETSAKIELKKQK